VAREPLAEVLEQSRQEALGYGFRGRNYPSAGIPVRDEEAELEGEKSHLTSPPSPGSHSSVGGMAWQRLSGCRKRRPGSARALRLWPRPPPPRQRTPRWIRSLRAHWNCP
jgi:hypothetical protein